MVPDHSPLSISNLPQFSILFSSLTHHVRYVCMQSIAVHDLSATLRDSQRYSPICYVTKHRTIILFQNQSSIGKKQKLHYFLAKTLVWSYELVNETKVLLKAFSKRPSSTSPQVAKRPFATNRFSTLKMIFLQLWLSCACIRMHYLSSQVCDIKQLGVFWKIVAS
jgi:hypothetical protein